MSLLEEAAHGVWGGVRLIRHDPRAFEEFNITADGFWRSFLAILPVSILAWPLFISAHGFAIETAREEGRPPPEFDFGRDYLYLCAAFAIWPLIAAALARALRVERNYARYLIAYNWVSVPAMLINAAPHLLQSTGLIGWQAMALLAMVVFLGLGYLSWYVAVRGLETTPLIAAAFLAADYALSFALDWVIR
ncbi:MAG: hypothetical protein ACJ8AS_03635 [Hyphomicrobiales bacterium]